MEFNKINNLLGLEHDKVTRFIAKMLILTEDWRLKITHHLFCVFQKLTKN